MTRPIYEPSLPRTDAVLGYGSDQLFRRPAPAAPASAVAIEWVYYKSTTNWGSGGLTTLTFTLENGNYDAVTPTFNLSGGNPQIKKDGHYQTQIGIYNYSPVVGVETIMRADFGLVSGPNPGSWRGPSGVGANLLGGIWSAGPVNAWPFFQNFWNFSPGTFIGTPSTWKVQAWRLDDGVITADTDVIVLVAFQRLGDSFV